MQSCAIGGFCDSPGNCDAARTMGRKGADKPAPILEMTGGRSGSELCERGLADEYLQPFEGPASDVVVGAGAVPASK